MNQGTPRWWLLTLAAGLLGSWAAAQAPLLTLTAGSSGLDLNEAFQRGAVEFTEHTVVTLHNHYQAPATAGTVVIVLQANKPCRGGQTEANGHCLVNYECSWDALLTQPGPAPGPVVPRVGNTLPPLESESGCPASAVPAANAKPEGGEKRIDVANFAGTVRAIAAENVAVIYADGATAGEGPGLQMLLTSRAMAREHLDELARIVDDANLEKRPSAGDLQAALEANLLKFEPELNAHLQAQRNYKYAFGGPLAVRPPYGIEPGRLLERMLENDPWDVTNDMHALLRTMANSVATWRSQLASSLPQVAELTPLPPEVESAWAGLPAGPGHPVALPKATPLAPGERLPADEVSRIASYTRHPAAELLRQSWFRSLLAQMTPQANDSLDGRIVPLAEAFATAIGGPSDPVAFEANRYYWIEARRNQNGRGRGFVWIDSEQGLAIGGYLLFSGRPGPAPSLMLFSTQLQATGINLPAALREKLDAWLPASGAPAVVERYFAGFDGVELLTHEADACPAQAAGDCAHWAAQAAENDMEAAYELARTALLGGGSEPRGPGSNLATDSPLAKLIAQQEQWLATRNASCQAPAAGETTDACLTRVNRARARELLAAYETVKR